MASDSPSERLRLFRESLGLSQGQLGKKIGRSQAFIAKVEGGQGAPSADLQARLYAEFSLNSAWLMHGRGDMYLSSRDAGQLPGATLDVRGFAESMAMIDGRPGLSDGFATIPFHKETGDSLNLAPFALSRAWLKAQEIEETDLCVVRLLEDNPQLGLLRSDLALVDGRKPVRATGEPIAFFPSLTSGVKVALLFEVKGQGFVMQDPETGMLHQPEDWGRLILVGRLVAHWRMHTHISK